MRSIVIGGGHAAFFVISTLREVDPDGKITIIETTVEKAGMAEKQFPFAEVISLGIDDIIEYLISKKKEIDVLVTCTGSDALNFKLANGAVKAGLHRVIAIVNNPLNEPHFKKAGVRFLISPFSMIESKLMELLGEGIPVKLYEGLEKRVALYSLIVPKSCKVELKDEEGLVHLFTKSHNQIVDKLGEKLRKGDIIYIFGDSRKAKKVAERLAKDVAKG
jgi:Trk K+ transport system NAD-binding subunit